MGSDEVSGLGVERDGAVLRLTLQRPDKRNSLSREMIQALVGLVENAPDDESIRAIAISGEGDHFCGGADWVATNASPAKRATRASGAPQPQQGEQRPRVASIHRRTAREAHRLIQALMTIQLPVVCRVNGWAAGIGCHIALASDFVVAADDARFWEPFAKRGFTPDSGGTWLASRLIGVARAKSMLLLGREVTGKQAAEWGMIHEACAPGDLDRAAEALVQELAAGATATIGLTKYAIARSLELPLEQAMEIEAFALELSSRSLDFKEGLKAFREKRDPKFEGR